MDTYNIATIEGEKRLRRLPGFLRLKKLGEREVELAEEKQSFSRNSDQDRSKSYWDTWASLKLDLASDPEIPLDSRLRVLRELTEYWIHPSESEMNRLKQIAETSAELSMVVDEFRIRLKTQSKKSTFETYRRAALRWILAALLGLMVVAILFLRDSLLGFFFIFGGALISYECVLFLSGRKSR